MVTRAGRFRVVVATIALASLLGGCGGGGPVRTDAWRGRPHDPGRLDLPPEAAVTCPPRGAGAGDRVIRLALPGAVQPSRAPLPATEAERHLFASLYEPLVRVDCDGRVRPALAERWRAYDGGRVWVLHLRRGARFWDGRAVDASAVIASWRRSEALCRLRGEPSPFLLFDPGGGSLAAVGAHEVHVRLRQPSDTLPLLLAHPALAVVGDPDGRGWLAGSGPCAPVSTPAAAPLALEAAPGHPLAPDWSRLEIVRLTGEDDPRDALDLGAHALVSRAREVHEFYAGLARVRVFGLPWDRWYYLVTPSEDTGADPADRRRWTAGWQRLELAREVGGYIAEPADFGPYEPQRPLCPGLKALVPERIPPPLPDVPDRPSLDEDLILWPADDPDAGQLAERLASLAARPLRPGRQGPGRGPLEPPREPGPGTRPTALAVADDALLAHLQQARAGAVVLPWPRRFPQACDEVSRLLSLAHWLQDVALSEETDAGAVPPGARPSRFAETGVPPEALAAMRRLERARVVQPLVRSRAVLVSRPAVRGWSWNLDGSLRLWAPVRND